MKRSAIIVALTIALLGAGCSGASPVVQTDTPPVPQRTAPPEPPPNVPLPTPVQPTGY